MKITRDEEKEKELNGQRNEIPPAMPILPSNAGGTQEVDRRVNLGQTSADNPNIYAQGINGEFVPGVNGAVVPGVNQPGEMFGAPIIGKTQIKEALRTLEKYRQGKSSVERRVVQAEDFWKLRQWGRAENENKRTTPATAWLWNVLVSKHADAMDALPEPNILPKEETDKNEAKILSSIVPVILAQNGFKKVYSENMWDKLKQGTGIYGVFWDNNKLNGLGDVAVRKIDVLNCFWEPGISDIQDSANFFTVELRDKKNIISSYPDKASELEKNLKGGVLTVKKYRTDDTVDDTDKAVVVDWYYKKTVSGRTVLHYCKFVNDVVLFSTENDPEHFPDGLYDHGKYPFVFDVFYPVKGSPCGYGYTDVLKDDQIQIDELSDALIKNAKQAAKRRYFSKMSGGVNEEEFADWDKDIVHVEGDLDEKHVKAIEVPLLNSIYYSLLEWKVSEIKETSGNRDVNNGGTSASVTAASAIAALQEASGKTSRDFIKTTYDAYEQIVKIVIELIRQFYTETRKFRIVGTSGAMQFVDYSNANIAPNPQPMTDDDGNIIPGAEAEIRLPDFDIEVTAQKNIAYTKAAQNELALQFYNAGFFNPQLSDQALATVSMMDFDHKDDVISKISENRTLYDQVMQLQQLSVTLLSEINPQKAAELAQSFGMDVPAVSGGTINPSAVSEQNDETSEDIGGESSGVAKARERTRNSTQL